MKTLLLVITAAFMCLVGDQFYGFGSICYADSLSLDANEASMLAYLREEQKFLRDCHTGIAEQYKQPMYIEPAEDALKNMDRIKYLLSYYGVEDPVTDESLWAPYSPDSTFWTEELDLMSYNVGWGAMPYLLNFSAYLEEMSIRDLWHAIDITDDRLLIDAYAEILEDSYDHLRLFATAAIDNPGLPSYYEAQILSQDDVDAILAGTIPPVAGFTINAGLNDSWYDPATSGQGFFITVLPGSHMMSISWMTYDTELPDENVVSHLGGAGQRWLLAHGQYTGAQAELTIYSAEGGLFDLADPKPEVKPIGTMTVLFDSCSSGSIAYDLPTVNRAGTIDIQRVALDNVAACEGVH